VIPDETIERLRESADIVAIVGEYVDLRKVGTDYRGPCPFHQGTHRNFSVSAKRGSYKCFVCGEGGDVFTFLQKRLGLDWPAAVRLVGEKTGIEVRDVNTRRDQGPDPREPLWEINAAAADYFRRMLWEDDLGAPAREYLEQRRVERALADRFGLGWAPREIGLMRTHLGALGFDDERLLAAGLLVRAEESDEPRPRFRSRLVFPIHDVAGHPAGFGGRLLGPGEPKYLNSAESATFSKGRLLYNLQAAKQHIRRDERVLLVEGYFDVVRLVAAGIESVVAPLGTSLTDEQARLVARYTKHIYLLYDSDQAGLKATFRAGDELLRHGCAVQVVTLPEGEDPDTFVDSRGGAALEHAIAAAIDIFERKIQLLERGGWFADLVRKRRAIDRLLPTIRATADPLTRDLYLNRAAEASGISRALLERELESTPAGERTRAGPRVAPRREERGPADGAPPPDAGPPPWMRERQMELRGGERRGSFDRRGRRLPPRGADVRPATEPRGARVERELLRAMLHARGRVDGVLERLGPQHFLGKCTRALVRRFGELGADADVAALAEGLEAPCVELLNRLLMEPEAVGDVDRTIEGSVNKLLGLRDIERRRADILKLIELAEGAEREQLLAEERRLKREIQQVDPRWIVGGG
jgi:DNA primase